MEETLFGKPIIETDSAGQPTNIKFESWEQFHRRKELESLSQAITDSLAIRLFAIEISKPYPVNADVPQDFDAIAKQCVERAKQTSPFLLRELTKANE